MGINTYFHTFVAYLVAGGVTAFDDLDRFAKDSLLIHHFEDKQSEIAESYLEEFLLESLVEQASIIPEILTGDYTGIGDAVRNYADKYGILEDLWNAEILRLEAQQGGNIASA